MFKKINNRKKREMNIVCISLFSIKNKIIGRLYLKNKIFDIFYNYQI